MTSASSRALTCRGDKLQTSGGSSGAHFLLQSRMRGLRINALLAVLVIVTTGAPFVFVRPTLSGQAKEFTEKESPYWNSFEILTNTKGVDLTAFMTGMGKKVNDNWHASMPTTAKQGDKGTTVLRFQIQRDGTLLGQTPTVERSSGNKSLDQAAVTAIRSSAPFDHLPESVNVPHIDVRFRFFYNLPRPPATNPWNP